MLGFFPGTFSDFLLIFSWDFQHHTHQRTAEYEECPLWFLILPNVHYITICFPFLTLLLWAFRSSSFPLNQHTQARFHLSQCTLTHLWHLSSSCWSSSCLSQPTPRSAASILPPGTRARPLASCLPLHCPGQALHLHCRLLLQGLWRAGRPRALSLASHRHWTATRPSGNPPGSLDTVCRRGGRLVVVQSAPGRSWWSLCRPGTRASDGGRKGPADRATADWLLGPLSEGSSCSPRWGCWGGRSACSCWLADPWCNNTSHNLD